MRKRKGTNARRTVQLELFPDVALPAPASGLWKEVEELPTRVERFNQTRRKLVKPRLSQAQLAQLMAPPRDPLDISGTALAGDDFRNDVARLLAMPPHLTQAQADALDDVVIQEDCHGAQGNGGLPPIVPLAPLVPE